MNLNQSGKQEELRPYFTRPGVWAFSVGTSIGWGSFVVTCNTYLTQAGILGTVLGLLLGMAVVLIVNRNLCYMMERSANAGGIYSYGTGVRGHDTGFLIGWFLLLTYLAILWANITSLPLFARRFFGTLFQFGYCYTVFGYDVFAGEVLLSVAAVVLVGLLCTRFRKLPQMLMLVLTVLFLGSVTVCTVGALVARDGAGTSFAPAYIPDSGHLRQIVRIAVISPWAFIGFENVSHFSQEFSFPVKKIRSVMLASVLMTTAFYILMTLLSVTAFPPEYENWLAYIRDMDRLEGLQAIPAFYAASRYLGGWGMTLLVLALLSVVLTSIIANLTALSRLLYALGRDRVAPVAMGTLNRFHIPGKAIWAVVALSCLIPFLGRTAIGWIVDVTTLGATIIYGFLSDSVRKDAKNRGDRLETVTGAAGEIIMIGFAVLLLVPNLLSFEPMASESYLLFAAWSLLGLLTFRIVLWRSKERVFGRSVIVWIVLLLLMMLTILMWVNRKAQIVTEESMGVIGAYYEQAVTVGGGMDASEFLGRQSKRIGNAISQGMLVSLSLIIISVAIMVNNYRTALSREREWEEELFQARERSLTDSLTRVKNKHAYRQWEQRIDAEIEAGDCAPFAVVVCDINDLKLINDRIGHKAGDDCIRRVSKSICDVFSHSPVFRYGGDEFVVLLRGEDYNNRLALLSQIDRESANAQENGGDVIAAGMAEYDSARHNTMLRVFELADSRMYARKQALKQRKAELAAGNS